MPEYIWIYDNRQGSEYFSHKIHSASLLYKLMGTSQRSEMEHYGKIIIVFNYFFRKTQS